MPRRKRPKPTPPIPTVQTLPPKVPAAPLAVAPELVRLGRRRRLYRAALVSGALVLAPSTMAARSPEQPRPPVPASQLAASRTLLAEPRLEDLADRFGQRPAPTARSLAGSDTDAADAATTQAGQEAAPTPLARVGDVELVTPTAAPLVVGFHEAAGGTTEVLEPLATLDDDHNPGVARAAPDAMDTEEPTVVLPTRDRGSHPTSAVDIAVEPDERILSPVSGVVASVSPYTLYGQHADWRIEIAAAEDPSIRVIVVHVTDPTVEVGDGLVAGASVIAESSTQFPFASQIDRLTTEVTGYATPHVHVEVKRA